MHRVLNAYTTGNTKGLRLDGNLPLLMESNNSAYFSTTSIQRIFVHIFLHECYQQNYINQSCIKSTVMWMETLCTNYQKMKL